MTELPVQAGSRRVPGNDWGVLSPPAIGDWEPTRTVSVIIPAYDCQSRLDLTLAALSRQTYPRELLQVLVVDDGSDPALRLPEVVPDNCRIIRVCDHTTGWGRANALHLGVQHTDGDILHWLDADVVLFPEHIEALARWHHLVPDAVTLGYKRFVRDGWTTPDEVLSHCAAGTMERLFPLHMTDRHDFIEEIIDSTDQLRAADHLAFRAHAGATTALRRELYLDVGGLDRQLRLGEDTEFGYRSAQAGALFIPERQARSWHMGPSHMMAIGAQLRRYNQPFLAARMPHPRWLRGSAGRIWAVPLVTAVIEVGDNPLELVRTCVDRLLTNDEQDLRVRLVGDWPALTDERRPVLGDPLLELRLIAATYRDEPRVRLVDTVPDSVFPCPYLLRVPVHLGVGHDTVRRLVEEADAGEVGMIRLLMPGAGPGLGPPALELWRTAALSRARRHRYDGEALADAVTEMFGARWLTGTDFGVVDLSTMPIDELASPRAVPTRSGSRPRPAVSTPAHTVPVGGVRSLIRATEYVARLAAGRAWYRMRPGWRRART